MSPSLNKATKSKQYIYKRCIYIWDDCKDMNAHLVLMHIPEQNIEIHFAVFHHLYNCFPVTSETLW